MPSELKPKEKIPTTFLDINERKFKTSMDGGCRWMGLRTDVVSQEMSSNSSESQSCILCGRIRRKKTEIEEKIPK